MTNAESLGAHLDRLTIPAELGPMVTLAETLAVQMDVAPTALMAAEYRKTLDALAVSLEAEGDGQADVVRLLSAVGDEA